MYCYVKAPGVTPDRRRSFFRARSELVDASPEHQACTTTQPLHKSLHESLVSPLRTQGKGCV